ncbi:dTDP-4-dehydrorhamnose reductase [Maribacter chungangensis]|uniref:dTDP-4-dehydrorhamnose reductase n=1 Tax=Maribacter chungangensis TaxID=1069117 RepID=A0ABW3B4T1_9FLAO
MIKVLVTGARGQLGSAIKSISNSCEGAVGFTYCTSAELNITDIDSVMAMITTNSFDYCINCAAYTNVDKAEENSPQAYAINGLGAENLAIACKKANVTLIHISTDFVFSGKQSQPYLETDGTEPLGSYGKSKLRGEQDIQKQLDKHYIIRTSWLYSEFGANFMKSMLRLGSERAELSVVFDQIGTPTYAVDLAKFIIYLVQNDTAKYGIYHYSNEGVASWYDFAKAIFEEAEINVKLKPIRTKEYPLPAKRPSYSVMDKAKVKTSFNIEIPHWRDSLKEALKNYNSK